MKRIIFLCLVLIAGPIWADQLIVEPDMGRAPLLAVMAQASKSLKLVMYGFTDQSVLNTLLAQKSKGDDVKVLLEAHPYQATTENSKTIASLKSHHIPWQGNVAHTSLLHQKTLIIDANKAWVMTFNFTDSTFKNERNFALVIDDPAQVKTIDSLFNADWQHLPPGTTDSIILSPQNSRQKIMSLIGDARQAIRIYAQTVDDYQIVGALAQCARRGVEVRILTTASLRPGQERYLLNAGVKIHYTHAKIIHAKVMLIDNDKLMLGSINLTSSSLDKNRELAVISHDANVIKQLNRVFAKDWFTT